MKPNPKKFGLILFCFVLLISQEAFCRVKLPLLVSDGMVLQRDANVKIWGWADANEKIVITFNDKSYETSASADGKWAVILSELKAGGPFVLDINASNHIALKNIMVGDVWVCSGQSNMELPMNRVKYKYPEEIARADNPDIRLFNVPRRHDFQQPQDDFESGRWVPVNSKTILDFTAVGYFFAKELYEKYHVPIGLLNASLGGSPAEAWMSEDALKEFPEYLRTAKKYQDSNYIKLVTNRDKAASDAWYSRLQQLDYGLAKGQKPWFDPNFNSSGWPTMNIPGYWADTNLGNVNGVVWFRKEIDVPASMTGKPARLWLGRIVDGDFTYVNGKQVGSVGLLKKSHKYLFQAIILKTKKHF